MVGEYHVSLQESICRAKLPATESGMAHAATHQIANALSRQGRGLRQQIRRTLSLLTPRSKAVKFHPSLKPAFWGAVTGAVAISVIGFTSMGWTLDSTAERMATKRADNAIVGVLVPICVEKFQQQADSAAKLIEFKKAASWNQRTLIENGGWATTPGTEKANSAVAGACAEKLARLS
jgi:hypothetical protein